MAEEMQGKSFPQGDEQGEQFIYQMSKIINTDDEIVRVLKEETGKEAPVFTIVGAIAAQILTLLFSKLYEQTGGQKVSGEFVVQIIRAAVKEISDIADSLGLNTTVEDEKQAAKIAGDALDQSISQLYDGEYGKRPPMQEGQAPPQGGQVPPQGGQVPPQQGQPQQGVLGGM